MKKIKPEILEESKSNLGEKYFNEYLNNPNHPDIDIDFRCDKLKNKKEILNCIQQLYK